MTRLAPGARVIRKGPGKDWPGTVKGRPWTADDGERIRVDYDGGSSVDTPVVELVAEPTTVC